MEQLTTLVRWGAFAFIIALLLIVLYKMLNGTISLDGLLTGEQKDGTQYTSVGRTQLIVLTLVSAAIYVKRVTSSHGLDSLPPIPSSMLEVVGGSQLFYLAGKARAMFFGPNGTSSEKGR